MKFPTFLLINNHVKLLSSIEHFVMFNYDRVIKFLG